MTSEENLARIEELKVKSPVVAVHKWRWRVLTVVIVLLGGLSSSALAIGVHDQQQRNRTAACQARVNAEFRQTIVDRNNPNIADREALDKVVAEISSVLDGTSAKTIRSILTQYQATRAADDAARSSHPLTSEPDRC